MPPICVLRLPFQPTLIAAAVPRQVLVERAPCPPMLWLEMSLRAVREVGGLPLRGVAG